MPKSRRRTVLSLAGISLLIVVVAALFSRERLLEQWYIYQLASEDESVSDHAVRRLAAAKSVRAIPALIEHAPREFSRGRRIQVIHTGTIGRMNTTDSPLLKALFDFGDLAKEAVALAAQQDATHFKSLSEIMQSGQQLDYQEHLNSQLELMIFE